MALLLAFWAIAAIGIGHADAGRLLAATVLVRAPWMLSQMSTLGALRRRDRAPSEVRRPAKRLALGVQLAVLAALVAEIILLCLGLLAVGEHVVAHMLALAALGLPARLIRAIDPRFKTPYMQSFNAVAGVAGAALALVLGWGPLGFALAYGLRDWIALPAVWIFRPAIEREQRTATDEPLVFAEIARNTVVNSRRLITYRLTKNLLTVFGPFGNFAARTGRGLNLHGRLEPYVPHRRGGFALFALIAAIVGVALIAHIGEPVALIAGAGALQLSAIALNVLLWWRYLPRRDDPSLVIEEDDED